MQFPWVQGGEFRLKDHFALPDAPECTDDITDLLVFADEGTESEAGALSLSHFRDIIGDAHQDDLGKEGMQDTGGFKSVHDRHMEIEQDDVRHLITHAFEQFSTIGGFKHHMDAAEAFEDQLLGKQRPEIIVIIGQGDLYGIVHAHK